MPGKIRVLFIGDIIGRPGRRVLKKFLPRMIEESGPTFIIANGENTAGGVGITEKVGQELFEWVDVLSSGNHVWDKKEGISYIDREPKILRPANYPPGSPGKGSGVFLDKNGEKIGVLNLQGRVFMEPIDCPFRTADRELENLHRETTAIIIDFHAEATSEKQALGWYLDGRVSAVIGTHTHVPTADEKILPGGTAYITDVGMAGGYISVIGIRRDQAIKRFLTSRPQHFEPSKEGNFLSTVVFDIDPRSGKASSIKRKIFAEENIE